MRQFNITVNGEVFEVAVEEIGGNAAIPTSQPVPQLTVAPKPVSLVKPKAQGPASAPAKASPTAGGHKIQAPLPGLCLNITVSVGQQVKAGDVLLILEAMKMENEVTADFSGQIKEILVDKGATVGAGDVLVVIE